MHGGWISVGECLIGLKYKKVGEKSTNKNIFDKMDE